MRAQVLPSIRTHASSPTSLAAAEDETQLSWMADLPMSSGMQHGSNADWLWTLLTASLKLRACGDRKIQCA